MILQYELMTFYIISEAWKILLFIKYPLIVFLLISYIIYLDKF